MSRKPKVFNTLKLEDPLRGRFNLQLDSIDEGGEIPVVQNVQERFPGFFDCPDKCQPYKFELGCDAYSMEDGFPETLDLSAYYINGDKSEKKVRAGMSVFATEYERLHGDLKEADVPESLASSSAEPESYDHIDRENNQRIEQMDEEEIQRSLKEIYERLDPSTIDYLRNRSKQKTEKPKLSLFKQRKTKEAGDSSETKNPSHDQQQKALEDTKNQEFIKQLEIISDEVLVKHAKDDGLKEYSRLAMDPMHMDFAQKYIKSMVPSQERNLIRLFEKLKLPPKHYDGSDALLNLAHERLDKITELYLEDFINERGQKERRFAKDVNPMVNSSWSLVPIRRVVDAQAIRGDSNVNDDREIVELTLLWTVLLLREQPTYFNLVHGVPGDIYCRLAELYLLGPEIFKSTTIEQCVDVLIHEFLVPKASDGKLSLKLTKAISGLDAFLPLYEDLLKHFLEFSYGDPRFSVLLLMAAYMNSSLSDALTMRCLLWSAAKDVIKQMRLSVDEISPILDYVRKNLDETTQLLRQQFPDQMNILFHAYDNAIKNGLITKDRNSGLYKLAEEQLETAIKE